MGMRITELEPGMRCFMYGRREVEILEVIRSDRDAGIYYPYARIRYVEDGVESQASAASLVSKAQVDEADRQKRQRDNEVDRICQGLREFLPSISGKNYYGDEGVMISMDERDCLKILERLGAKEPPAARLPSAYPMDDPRSKKNAVLLAQRLRRAIGSGYCSKWHFSMDWKDADQPWMFLYVDDQALDDLRVKLSGQEEQGSALSQLFG